MSDSTPSEPTQPGRPNTSCLGCRRRKLKCSREHQGCTNCTKADLPCVYPVPETGVKRKRGPYRKDKPARERHLEELVKYLEPGTLPLDRNSTTPSDYSGQRGAGDGHSPAGQHSPAAALPHRTSNPLDEVPTYGDRSEGLVKDALIALTRSSAADRETYYNEVEPARSVKKRSATAPAVSSDSIHPPVQQIFVLWQLFVDRVDPLTKIIHCPTFAEKLATATTQLDNLDPCVEILLFSIYHAAVSTCTASEAREKFGKSRTALIQQYGRSIEGTVAENYSIPSLESLQALTLYIVSLRRRDDGVNIRTLFGLAVRMAQLINLHEDPGDRFSPFDTEMRRRLWWQICGLESRGAEELVSRSTSVMHGCDVKMPSNLEDFDLDPSSQESPRPRTGVTGMTFVRIRNQVVHMAYSIWQIRQDLPSNASPAIANYLKETMFRAYERTIRVFDDEFKQHLHPSRPYDWMCMVLMDGMLAKACMMIDHPGSQPPIKQMTPEERYRLLQYSVLVVRMNHTLVVDPRIIRWRWFYLGYVQWHSLGIIIAELGCSKNELFSRHAWAALDPMLADWGKTYEKKQGEPAWDHVNTLIERAKEMRAQNVAQRASNNHTEPTAPSAHRPTHNPAPQSMPHNGPPYPAPLPLTAPGTTVKPPDRPAAPEAPYPNSTSFDPLAYAPQMLGFEDNFGTFDDFDSVDFNAFNTVFGNATWDWVSPMTDSLGEGMVGEMGEMG